MQTDRQTDRQTDNSLVNFLFSLNFYCIILFLVTVVYIFLSSKQYSIVVPTNHLDGAYQTATGLFRILNGELIGRDFYHYLGIGTIAYLFPAFVVFGAKLCSSVLAAFFMTRISFFLILVILSYIIFKRKWWINIAIGALFYIVLANVCYSNLVTGTIKEYLQYLLEPGNSLKPIRAFLSYLSLFVVAFSCSHLRDKVWLFRFVISIVFLVCFTWSNDYGIPSIFGVLLVLLFNKVKISEIIKIALLFIIISFVILSLISDFSYFAYIDYNFNGVRKDQWWYFAPYNNRVFSLKDLKYLIFMKDNSNFLCNLYPIFLSIILLASYFITKNIKWGYCAILLLINFLGGSIASVGGHISYEYFFNFIICSYLISLFIVINKVISICCKENKILAKKYVYIILVFVLLLVNIVIIYQNTRTFRHINKFISNQTEFSYIDSYDGYLSNEYIDYLAFVKDNLKNHNFVEEYYGLASAYFNIKPLWKVDSVIHVLGNKLRADSSNVLNSVDYVITSRYVSGGTWVLWSFTQNYWFYKKVLQEFKPVFYGPQTIIWKRDKDNGVVLNNSNCSVTPNQEGFMINDSRKGFYEIKLTYQIHSSRLLLMAKNNISTWGGNAASLNTVASSMEIPVYFDGKNNRFKTIVYPHKRRSAVNLSKCEAKFYNVKDSKLLDFNLTK